MKKLAFRSILVGLVLLATSLLALILWMESAHFAGIVGKSLKAQASAYNLCLDYARLRIHPLSLQAEIDDLRIDVCTDDPLARVEKVYASLRILDLFTGSFALDKLVATHPVIHLKFKEDGSSNLSQIRLPEANSSLSSGSITIDRGELIWDGTSYSLSGRLGELNIALQSLQGEARVKVATADCQLNYAAKTFEIGRLEGQATLYRSRATIEQLLIESPYATTTLNGQLLIQELSYSLKLYSRIDLKLAEPLTKQLLDVPVAGSVAMRGQIDGRASDFKFNGSLESKELAVSRLELKDLNLTATLPILSGALEVGQLRYGAVQLSRLSTPVQASSSRLELTHLKASLLGGEVYGQLRLALNGESSSLKLDFKSLDLAEVAAALTSKIRLTGKLSGRAESRWLGYNLASSVTDLTGRLEAAPTAETPTPKALTGEFAGRLVNRSLVLSKSSLLAGSSRLSATGKLGLEDFDLEVGFSTLDLEDALAVASQLAMFEPPRGRLHAQGGASFSGRVSGSPSRPTISGLLQLQNLQAEQESLGRFGATVEYTLGRLVIKDGRLVQEDGGEARVDFDGPLAGDGLGVTSLDMRGYQIGSQLTGQIRRVLGHSLPIVSTLDTGSITGRLTLSGVPSPGRLAQGELNLKQIANRLKGQGSILVINSESGGKFQSFEADFALSHGHIDLKDVAATLKTGRVSGYGSYDIASEDYNVDASADLNLSEFAQELTIRGLPTSGIVSAKLKGVGRISSPQFELSVTCPKLSVGGVELSSLQLSSSAVAGVAKTRLKAVYLNQPYEITGKVRLSDDFLLEADAEIREKSLLPLLSLFTRIPPRLATLASGRISLYGPLMPDNRLSLRKVRLTASLDSLEVIVSKIEEDDLGYTATNDGSILIEAMGNRVHFRSLRLKGEGTSLSVAGSYSVDENSQLDLQGQASLKLLNTLSNSVFADGIASMGVQVYGSSTGKVRLKGIAEVRNVSLRYVGLPLALQQGSGRVVFNTDRLVLENFNARVGGGAVRLSGGLLLDKENIGFRLGINATDVKVNYPQSSRSTFSGNLVLQGTQKLQVLSGNINVSQFEYRENTDLATVLGAGAGAAFVSDPTRESSLKLDVSINAQDTLSVNNNLAELTGSASLKLTGSVNNPVVSGEASVTRGTLFLRNERYQITRGLFFFPGTRSRQVQFDVESDTEIRGYRVILNLSGSLEKLNVALRSEPALSQVDIVNLLTTGQPPTSIGQIQAAGSVASGQVAANTAAGILFGTLSSQVEQRTDKLFGLNRFQIDPLLTGRGSNPTARITIGRRITRNLSVTYSTDLSTGREQVFLLEYQIRRNISLIGIRNEDGSYGFEFRLRRQF